jgi:centrosomal protein CEP104
MAGHQQFEQQEQPNQGPGECGFCGQLDPSFNDVSLDIHYWRDCPMLIQCWECEQIMDISSLDQHFLEEC